MRDRKLLEVSVVTDDDTGIYTVGELDYGVHGETDRWLTEGDNRKRLTEWLRWLADQCESEKAPFGKPSDVHVITPEPTP